MSSRQISNRTWAAIKVVFYAYMGISGLSLTIFPDSPVSMALGIGIFVIIFVPLLFAGFLQMCFWVYQWLMFGNPLLEAGDVSYHHGERRVIGAYQARSQVIQPARTSRKKHCPICKRDTMCRVTRSKGIGAWIHVQQG